MLRQLRFPLGSVPILSVSISASLSFGVRQCEYAVSSTFIPSKRLKQEKT